MPTTSEYRHQVEIVSPSGRVLSRCYPLTEEQAVDLAARCAKVLTSAVARVAEYEPKGATVDYEKGGRGKTFGT